MGFARLAESSIKKLKGKGENDKLTALEKIASSSIGGALATWNQPIEVVRVEVSLHFGCLWSHLTCRDDLQMQSMAKSATGDLKRPQNVTILSTLQYVYKENGLKGLYRGVTPRIGLGIWQTVCMVSFADYVKAWYVFDPKYAGHTPSHRCFISGSRTSERDRAHG